MFQYNFQESNFEMVLFAISGFLNVSFYTLKKEVKVKKFWHCNSKSTPTHHTLYVSCSQIFYQASWLKNYFQTDLIWIPSQSLE